MRRSTTLRALAVAATVGVLAAGCSDDDDGTVAAEQTLPPPAATTRPEPATTGAPVAGEISVVLSDFAFGGLPDTVPAGTRLRIENTSKNELHELVAFRLPDDETRPVEELLELPDAEQAALFESGPPAMVLLAPPGGEQITALGDGTLAERGRYLVLCAIPTGADPEEYMRAAAEADGPPQVPGGKPHFMRGMVADVTVE
jgi:hypothetical protein